MKTNLKVKREPIKTHEGARASHITPYLELRRTVMACLLWEDNFYESGESVADRIKKLVPLCKPFEVAELAIETRKKGRLRHVPLLLVRELARHSSGTTDGLISQTLFEVISRADELTEFLSIYWKDCKPNKRDPLSGQVKKGLAKAFRKFTEYQLAKYNRDGAVKLRDVLFLCHARPKDEEQSLVWKRLVEGTMKTPDTWETNLSAGEDKKETFTRLITENKLGYMALLRNLRNMNEVGVDTQLVVNALASGADKSKALPFRFIAAANHAPNLEVALDLAMQVSMKGMDKLPGKTALIVDCSGSMGAHVSDKSEMTRMDAAAALCILVRGICDDVSVFAFGSECKQLPARTGMALRDAIRHADVGHATYIGRTIKYVQDKMPDLDRIILFTDEQSHDDVPDPRSKGYIINVASYKNGVGYGPWTHIDGFSEAIVTYIQELESFDE